MGNFEDRENRRKKSAVAEMIGKQQPEVAVVLVDEQESSSIETRSDNPHIIIEAKEKEETRSKRVNLLLPPSVYEKAQRKCQELGISLNECINQFLSGWVQK